MEQKKDLATLTLEELMEIAKLPLKDDETKNLPPVRRFIVSDGLQEGNDQIPAALIYDRYLNWSKINNLHPISMVHFFKELKLYYKKSKIQTGLVYFLSAKGFDLSPHKLATAISNQSAKRTSRGKKTRKKHQKEV